MSVTMHPTEKVPVFLDPIQVLLSNAKESEYELDVADWDKAERYASTGGVLLVRKPLPGTRIDGSFLIRWMPKFGAGSALLLAPSWDVVALLLSGDFELLLNVDWQQASR